MAQLPVESMATGGLGWFTDLTVYDPYFVLPIASALTMLVTIEVCNKYVVAQYSLLLVWGCKAWGTGVPHNLVRCVFRCAPHSCRLTRLQLLTIIIAP